MKNYLYKIVSYAKEEYVELNEVKVMFLKEKKEQYRDKINAISTIKDEVIT